MCRGWSSRFEATHQCLVPHHIKRTTPRGCREDGVQEIPTLHSIIQGSFTRRHTPSFLAQISRPHIAHINQPFNMDNICHRTKQGDRPISSPNPNSSSTSESDSSPSIKENKDDKKQNVRTSSSSEPDRSNYRPPAVEDAEDEGCGRWSIVF